MAVITALDEKGKMLARSGDEPLADDVYNVNQSRTAGDPILYINNPDGVTPEVRRKLLDAVVSGRASLVRADLPGRHIVGSLPTQAVLDVDGIQVPGRVLGALEQPSELQSAGLLIEVQNPPAGLAPQ